MRIFFLALYITALAGAQENGTAVYYADHFQGKPVASGEKYDKNEYTAAHRSLPFGTTLRVTNVSNGKSVSVRVNDRMSKNSKRLVDLSRVAAEEIGLVQAGRATVRISVLKRGDGKRASASSKREVRTRKVSTGSEKPTPFGGK